MAHLYANENFPQPVVDELRRLGHDVLTVMETGRAEQAWPDSDVLAFAINGNRAVLTLNRRHFVRLHKEHPDHHGIIVCTSDRDFAGQVLRIHEAIAAMPDLRGKLLRVIRPRT